MNLNEILDDILFRLGNIEVTLGETIASFLVLVFLLGFSRLLMRRWLPLYFRRKSVQPKEQSRIRVIIRICLVLLSLILISLITDIDPTLYSTGEEDNAPAGFRFSSLLTIVLIYLSARLSDWMISHVLEHNYQQRREALRKIAIHFEQPRLIRPARRLVQPVVYVFAALFLFYSLDIDFTKNLFQLGEKTYVFKLTNLLLALLIFFVARLVSWIISELFLYPYYQKRKLNIGSQYAINQLLKYFLYVIALLAAIQTLGINLTVLWGGAAALLVGLGLGLQQTFNDLISGVILLSERAVEVGDVLEMDGMVGSVRHIGLRTSLVETRDNITLIVPNSKLIGERVVNWSHDEDQARFHINVGVAYGSDTSLVKKILLDVAQEHSKVLEKPPPFVRFTDFGNSSLDFQLHFWSREFIRIEDVKSDMRFRIDQLFREHKVTIPFPQRDVWIRQAGQQE